MIRAPFALLATMAVTGAPLGWAQEEAPVVFRSDVSLVRVDVQVLDRNNRAIPGLRREDFTLREGGQDREIRNFASEEMPVDVVFLVDVSGSMRPHVERLARASANAMRVMGPDDRVAIMVFDRATRVRSNFMPQRELGRQMDMLLDQERFNGGTDITRAMLDAAAYVSRNARKDARRAIVILTDDSTEFDRAEARVLRELTRADTVMMALLAPDVMGYGGRGGRSRYPQGGGGGVGGWPGGPLGGIILGRGGRYPQGGGYPGGGGGGARLPRGENQSAGTAEIARDSGGDSLSIEEGSAVETTLSRIRQRYALYFLLPENARAGEQRQLDVTLAGAARRRYPDADLRYRRDYLSPSEAGRSTPSEQTVEPPPVVSSNTGAAADSDPTPRFKRRPVSDGSGSGPRGPNPDVGAGAATPSEPSPAQATADPAPAQQSGGWRKLKPGEKP